MKKKILFVFGTRPEAIKMAPVINFSKQVQDVETIICVTAQHRYLLDKVLNEFDLRPDIDLDLMKPNQTLYDIISLVSRAMKDVYRRVKPDIMLVQGDTSTVFAASLAAYYENIDIGHIEAGLRSKDNRNPFPEEINRKFVSLVARYNFCPTLTAKNNLLLESVDAKNIFVTGNTVIDALQKICVEIKVKRPEIEGITPEFLKRPYVLITGHRRENFDEGIKKICEAVKTLAKNHGDINWLWIVHLNPKARDIVFEILGKISNVQLIEPVAYKSFVYLMKASEFIISDSGGVQEEAPFLGKMVLVTRVCTERPEAIEFGRAVIVGTDPDKINKNANQLLKRNKLNGAKSPFGDGMAAKRIIDVITTGTCSEFRGLNV